MAKPTPNPAGRPTASTMRYTPVACHRCGGNMMQAERFHDRYLICLQCGRGSA